jgi:hypothetical protein
MPLQCGNDAFTYKLTNDVSAAMPADGVTLPSTCSLETIAAGNGYGQPHIARHVIVTHFEPSFLHLDGILYL